MKNRKLKAQNYQERHTKRAFKNKLRRKVLAKALTLQKLLNANQSEKPQWNTQDIVSKFLDINSSNAQNTSENIFENNLETQNIEDTVIDKSIENRFIESKSIENNSIKNDSIKNDFSENNTNDFDVE